MRLRWKTAVAVLTVVVAVGCTKLSVPTSPTDPVARLSLSASTVSFGSVTLGATATQRVSLRNDGDYPATITKVSVTGVGFAVTHDCGTSVAVSGTCTLTMTYSPTAVAASASGTVTVENSGGGTPSVALTAVSVPRPVLFLTTPNAVSVTSASDFFFSVGWQYDPGIASDRTSTLTSDSSWLSVLCTGNDVPVTGGCRQINGPGSYGRSVLLYDNTGTTPRTGRLTVAIAGPLTVTVTVTQAGR